MRIIALTASAFEHEREEILAVGCDDFVPKPFAEATIFDVLAEHLGTRFVFEEETAEPDAAAAPEVLTTVRLAALPIETLRALEAALQIGDRAAAGHAAEAVRGADPGLADEILRAVKEYRFEELSSLLAAVGRSATAEA